MIEGVLLIKQCQTEVWVGKPERGISYQVQQGLKVIRGVSSASLKSLKTPANPLLLF